jgi:glucose 1-dehydrogenase
VHDDPIVGRPGACSVCCEPVRAVAVLFKERQVRVIDVESPAVTQPTDVLLRVIDVGVCGTDKEICAFEYGAPPSGDDHLILGHECLAVVEEIGADVTSLVVGDLVVPSVRRPCVEPSCTACRAGHQDYCYTTGFKERGIKEAHGFMAEYVVDEARYLTRVPPELRGFAVLTEPLTIAQKALAQVFTLMADRPPFLAANTPPEARGHGLQAVVLGVGPVGLLGAISLVTAGFTTTVYSRERPPSPKTDLVAQIGASYRSSSVTSLTALAEELGNIDLVYEAAGQSVFALEGLRVLGTNGIYVLTGIPGEEALVEIDTAALMREMVLRNQVLLGTVNAGTDAFVASLRELQRFDARLPGVAATMLAGRFAPEDAAALVSGRQVGVKSVVSFGDPDG